MVSHKLLKEVVNLGKGDSISGGIAALNHRLQAVMPSASGTYRFVSGGIAALNHRHLLLESWCDVYGGTPTAHGDYRNIITLK